MLLLLNHMYEWKRTIPLAFLPRFGDNWPNNGTVLLTQNDNRLNIGTDVPASRITIYPLNVTCLYSGLR